MGAAAESQPSSSDGDFEKDTSMEGDPNGPLAAVKSSDNERDGNHVQQPRLKRFKTEPEGSRLAMSFVIWSGPAGCGPFDGG